MKVSLHDCSFVLIILDIRVKTNQAENVCIVVICTAPLLYSYMPAPTCFGSSLPSSESFWIRLSYVKIQIDMVVYHIMCLSGLCVGVSWFSLLCFPAECTQLGSSTELCVVLVISTTSNNARYEH
jgi:hypothetical protein